MRSAPVSRQGVDTVKDNSAQKRQTIRGECCLRQGGAFSSSTVVALNHMVLLSTRTCLPYVNRVATKGHPKRTLEARQKGLEIQFPNGVEHRLFKDKFETSKRRKEISLYIHDLRAEERSKLIETEALARAFLDDTFRPPSFCMTSPVRC